MEKKKDLAITSFVLGLFFWVPLLNIFIGVLAVFIGVKALINIKKNPKKYGGKGLAIIGIILGIIPPFFYFVGFIQCIILGNTPLACLTL